MKPRRKCDEPPLKRHEPRLQRMMGCGGAACGRAPSEAESRGEAECGAFAPMVDRRLLPQAFA